MCTVTLIRSDRGVRIVCNRDERRSRGHAIPPIEHGHAGRRAIYPVDPESGGTWIGVNDAGVFACLLNATPPKGAGSRGGRSRGEIVPLALAGSTLAQSLAAALSADAHAYQPYRLLIADLERAVVIGAQTSDVRVTHLNGPTLMLTSSSLGDHLVEEPRRALFNLAFATSLNAERAQDAFHRHHWDHLPSLSVRMSRAEARTVSRTVVELGLTGSTMIYTPLSDDGSEEKPTLALLTPAKDRLPQGISA